MLEIYGERMNSDSVLGSMNAQIKINHQSTDVVEADSVIGMEIEDIIKEVDT